METSREPGWFTSLWTAPTKLSEADWKARHKVVVAVLLAHFPVLLAFGLFDGTDQLISKTTFRGQPVGNALFEASIPALLGLVSLLPRVPRRVAATVASLGLVLASAVFTHLTGGYIEAHFHFFVVVGLAAVYVDWMPFVVTMGFVVIHHGVMGTIDPASVYNHPAAIAHPWRWAGIHTAFIVGLGATQLTNIGLTNRSLRAAKDSQEQAVQSLTERRSAEAVAVARGDFLRHMSHEVRTPLNAILGMANLMARDGGEMKQDRIDVINASGQHLLELIHELLDMNRIDGGEILLHPTEVDVAKFLDQIMGIARDQTLPGRVRLTLINAAPAHANFDRTRVRQVLLNLIANAAKHGGAGAIILRARQNGSLLEFSVQDHGPGIAAADIERIFEPYQQVGPEATRSGAGLGLAISRRLAEVMEGQLTVESSAGAGTTFTFSLPYKAVDSHREVPPESWASWANGKTVLLAEDDPFSAQVAAEFLESGGIKVTIVEDGAAAVQEASSKYDAILLDSRMPVLDGLGASQQIRKAGINIPIIGVSARATARDQQAARDAGMNDYLTKPLDFDDLMRTLRQQWEIAVHE